MNFNCLVDNNFDFGFAEYEEAIQDYLLFFLCTQLAFIVNAIDKAICLNHMVS